jgi:hypothetical protein
MLSCTAPVSVLLTDDRSTAQRISQVLHPRQRRSSTNSRFWDLSVLVNWFTPFDDKQLMTGLVFQPRQSHVSLFWFLHFV